MKMKIRNGEVLAKHLVIYETYVMSKAPNQDLRIMTEHKLNGEIKEYVTDTNYDTLFRCDRVRVYR